MQTQDSGPLGWNVGHFYFSKIIDDPIASERAREWMREIKNASGFTTQSDIQFFSTSVILSFCLSSRFFLHSSVVRYAFFRLNFNRIRNLLFWTHCRHFHYNRVLSVSFISHTRIGKHLECN